MIQPRRKSSPIATAAFAVLITVVASVMVSPAHAAGNTATVTGTANAAVVAPLVLTHPNTASLNFGKFTAGTGGTVVVTAAGTGSATSGVTLMSNSTNTADAFTVTGDASRSYAITTAAGTLTSGATTLNFTTTPSAASATTSTTGTGNFTVGGTLTVPSAAPTGTYTGTYQVTVTYN